MRPLWMTRAPVKSLAQLEAEKKYGSPYPRCTLWMRLGGRAVDLALAYGIFLLAGPRFGHVLAILYILLADGMLEGQSIGKRIFGTKVVHLPTRSAGRKRDSTLRNAPLALPILFGMMPEVGFAAFVGSAVIIGGVETWRVLRDPLGLRFGDVWAETQVVDGKVVAGAGAGLRSHDRSTATERATGMLPPRLQPPRGSAPDRAGAATNAFHRMFNRHSRRLAGSPPRTRSIWSRRCG